VWAGIVGIFAAGAGVAYATQLRTSTTNTIRVCAKKNGQLRLVDTFSECDKNESGISWNVQGPKGDKGEQGDTGPRGPQGPQGIKGDTGAQGPTGATGATGPQGDTGPPGAPGADGTSVTSSSVASGDANCATGGSKFDTPSGTTYACNGKDGKDGKDGTNGTNGTNGTGFNGSYTSPNGKFKLKITDKGIVLSGPGGTLTIDRTYVKATGTSPWSSLVGAP
jgi:hypothetical protein